MALGGRAVPPEAWLPAPAPVCKQAIGDWTIYEKTPVSIVQNDLWMLKNI